MKKEFQMKKSALRLTASLVCLTLALPAFATNYANYKDYKPTTTSTWTPKIYIAADGGYGVVDGAYGKDGDVAFGRLAFGIHALEYSHFSFGLEAGVQSGNDMRLATSSTILVATTGLPVQSTLKPLLDLLVTVNVPLLSNYPIIGIIKGGIAYRQLQLVGATSSKDTLQKVNAELQAGLGYNLTSNAMISAFYQGIYAGSNANLGIDSTGSITIGRIPTQQAGFLGIEYSL
jgi:hypothetical protein